MKKNKASQQKIDAKVRKTLAAFDDFEKVKANPFFYTRVRQRLGALDTPVVSSQPQSVLARLLRPALVPIFIAASVLVGVFIGYKPASVSQSEDFNEFTEIYSLQAPDLNDYVLASTEE